jgi:hypothetical protein
MRKIPSLIADRLFRTSLNAKSTFTRSNNPFSRLISRAPRNGFPNSWVITDFELDPSDVSKLTGDRNKIISNIDQYKKINESIPMFLIYFKNDSDASEQIKKIKEIQGKILPEPDSKKTEIRFRDKDIFEVLKSTWEHGDVLSHLKIEIHENLLSAIKCIDTLKGAYVEVGVYKGGTAFTALGYLKKTKQDRQAVFIDTFEGFNYIQSNNSFDSEWFGTHKINENSEVTFNQVSKTLKLIEYPFDLIKGNILDQEVHAKLPTQVAFLNIDVDQYDATKAALEYGYRSICSNGIILLEDTASTPRLYGAMHAMHEFLDSEHGNNFRHLSLATHDLLIRN